MLLKTCMKPLCNGKELIQYSLRSPVYKFQKEYPGEWSYMKVTNNLHETIFESDIKLVSKNTWSDHWRYAFEPVETNTEIQIIVVTNKYDDIIDCMSINNESIPRIEYKIDKTQPKYYKAFITECRK